MKVFYPGTMTGYHSVGRKGTKLTPGVNDVADDLAFALLDQGIVEKVEYETAAVEKKNDDAAVQDEKEVEGGQEAE